MVATVLQLASARVRQLGERFLALQTTIDDLGRGIDARPLERELEQVEQEVERTLASLAHHDELATSLAEACEARRAWRSARTVPGGEDEAADRFTLALIELALRLRGRPRRRTAGALV